MRLFRDHCLGYFLRILCIFLMLFNQAFAVLAHAGLEIDIEGRYVVLHPLKGHPGDALDQLIDHLGQQSQSEPRWTVYNRDTQGISLKALADLSKVADVVNQGDLTCFVDEEEMDEEEKLFKLGTLRNEGVLTFLDDRDTYKNSTITLKVGTLVNAGRINFEAPYFLGTPAGQDSSKKASFLWDMVIDDAIQNIGTLYTPNQLSVLNQSAVYSIGGDLQANGLTLKGFDHVYSTIVSGYIRGDLRTGLSLENLDEVPGYLEVYARKMPASSLSTTLYSTLSMPGQQNIFAKDPPENVMDFLWQGLVQTTGLTTLNLEKESAEAINADLEAFFDTRGLSVLVESSAPSRVIFSHQDVKPIVYVEKTDEEFASFHSDSDSDSNSGLDSYVYKDSGSETTTVDSQDKPTSSTFGPEGMQIRFASPAPSKASGHIGFWGEYTVEGPIDFKGLEDLYVAPASILSLGQDGHANAKVDALRLRIDGVLSHGLPNPTKNPLAHAYTYTYTQDNPLTGFRGVFTTNADVTVGQTGSFVVSNLENTNLENTNEVPGYGTGKKLDDQEQRLVNKGLTSVGYFSQNRLFTMVNSGEFFLKRTGGQSNTLKLLDNTGLVRSQTHIRSALSPEFLETFKKVDGSGFYPIAVNGLVATHGDIAIELPNDTYSPYVIDWWQSLYGKSIVFKKESLQKVRNPRDSLHTAKRDTALGAKEREKRERNTPSNSELTIKKGTTLSANGKDNGEGVKIAVKQLQTEQGSSIEAGRFIKFFSDSTSSRTFAALHGSLRSPVLEVKGYAFRGNGILDLLDLYVDAPLVDINAFTFGKTLRNIKIETQNFMLNRSNDGERRSNDPSNISNEPSNFKLDGQFVVDAKTITLKTPVATKGAVKLIANKLNQEGESFVKIEENLKSLDHIFIRTPSLSFGDTKKPLQLRGKDIFIHQVEDPTPKSQKRFSVPSNVLLAVDRLGKQSKNGRVQQAGLLFIQSPYDVHLGSRHSGEKLEVTAKSLFLEGNAKPITESSKRKVFNNFKDITADCDGSLRSTVPIQTGGRIVASTKQLFVEDIKAQQFDITATDLALFENSTLSSRQTSQITTQDLRLKGITLQGNDLIFAGVNTEAIHTFENVDGAKANVTQRGNNTVFFGNNTLRSLKSDQVTTIPEGSSLKVDHISTQPEQKIIDFRGNLETTQADFDLKAQKMILHNLKRTGGESFDSLNLQAGRADIQGTLHAKTGIVVADEELRLRQAKLMGQVFYLLSRKTLTIDHLDSAVTRLTGQAEDLRIGHAKHAGEALSLEASRDLTAENLTTEVDSARIFAPRTQLKYTNIKTTDGRIEGTKALRLAHSTIIGKTLDLVGEKAALSHSLIQGDTLKTVTDDLVSEWVHWKGRDHSHHSRSIKELDVKHTLAGSLTVLAEHLKERGKIIAKSVRFEGITQEYSEMDNDPYSKEQENKKPKSTVEISGVDLTIDDDFVVLADEIQALGTRIKARHAYLKGDDFVNINDAHLSLSGLGEITAQEIEAASSRIKAHMLRIKANATATLTAAQIDLIAQGELIAQDFNARAARIKADQALIQALGTLNLENTTVETSQAAIMAKRLQGINLDLIAGKLDLRAEKANLTRADIDVKECARIVVDQLTAQSATLVAGNAEIRGSANLTKADIRINHRLDFLVKDLNATSAQIQADILNIQGETINFNGAEITVKQAHIVAKNLEAISAQLQADSALLKASKINLNGAKFTAKDQAQIVAETLEGVSLKLKTPTLFLKTTGTVNLASSEIDVYQAAHLIVKELKAQSAVINAKTLDVQATDMNIAHAKINVTDCLQFIVKDLNATSASIKARVTQLQAAETITLNNATLTTEQALIVAHNLEAIAARIDADSATLKACGILNLDDADVKLKERADLNAKIIKGNRLKICAGDLFMTTTGEMDLSHSQINVEKVMQIVAQRFTGLFGEFKAQDFSIRIAGTANLQHAKLDVRGCLECIAKDLKATAAEIKADRATFQVTGSAAFNDATLSVKGDALIQANSLEAIAAHLEAHNLLITSRTADLSRSVITTHDGLALVSDVLNAVNSTLKAKDLGIKSEQANLTGMSSTSEIFDIRSKEAQLSSEKIHAKSANIHLDHYRNGIAGVIALAHDLVHCERVRLDAKNETLIFEGEATWRPNVTLALNRVEIGGTLRSTGDLAFEVENGGKVTGQVYARNFNLEAHHGDLEFYKALLNTTENLSLRAYEGDIHGKGNRFKAGHKFAMAAQNITEHSFATRQGVGENYKDVSTTSIYQAGWSIEIDAIGNIHFVGIKTMSGGDTIFQANGNFIDETLRLGSQTVYRGGRSMTRHTDTVNQRSEHDTNGSYIVGAGGAIVMQAPSISAQKSIRLAAAHGVTIADVHDIHEYEHYSHTEGGFFTSSRTIREQGQKARSVGANLKSEEGLEIDSGKDIFLTNVTVRAPRTTLRALKGVVKILQGTNHEVFQSYQESSNFFWQSQRSQQMESQTATASKFSGDIEITSKETILEQVRKRSLEFEKQIYQQGGKISYTFVDELYRNDVRESSGPSVALAAVISIAVAFATGGAGGIATQFGNYITQASAAVAGTTTASVISGMSSAMMTSLCAQSAVALVANQGNIFKAAADIISPSTLKNLAFSMATAGLMQGVGAAFDIDLNVSKFDTLAQHAQYQALSAGVGIGLDLASGCDFDEALVNRLKSAAVNTLAGYTANKIGDAVKTGAIDRATHKLLHAITGGAGGALLSRDAGRGAISGAVGAFMAETMADLLDPSGEVMEKAQKLSAEKGRMLTKEEYTSIETAVKRTTYDWSRLGTATAIMFAGLDVNMADHFATNALDNNFLVLIYWTGMAVSVGYAAYEFVHTLENEGFEAACIGLLGDAAKGIILSACGAAAAQGGAKLVAKLLEKSPALGVALSGCMDKIVLAADKFLENSPKLSKVSRKVGYTAGTLGRHIVVKRNDLLLREVEKKTGGVLKKAKKDGYIIQIPNKGKEYIEVKVMNKGGQRNEPYFRISVPGKRTLTKDGIPSDDKGLTHITIDTKTSAEDIIKLVEAMKRF